MAILVFPPSPSDGQIFPSPVFAPVGTKIYQWSALDQTWILLGVTTGATAGTYGAPTQVPRFTVDVVGRITFAEEVPIPLGDTTQVGLVQLTDNTVTNDPTTALTASQGFNLQQQINVIDARTANDIPLSTLINGNADVQSALNDAIHNVSSPGLTLTVTETAVGNVNLDVTQATEGQLGGAEVATQLEVDAGLDDSRFVTPLKLATYVSGGQIDATEIPLVPPINGNTNVQSALLDAVYDIASAGNTVVITSSPTGLFNVEVQQATETQLGGGEIATQAETDAGIDDTRIVTPLKLQNYILSSPSLFHYTQLDDIASSFDGLQTTFNLTIGAVPYAPNPVGNLMVHLGGAAQIPGAGNAYTVSGSTITFTSAPLAGTSFYATTVTSG